MNNLRAAGLEVREVLEKFVDDFPEVLELWDRLGTEEAAATPELLLAVARERVVAQLEATDLKLVHPKCK